MKKILYSVGLVVLSTFFFSSCQKEAEILTPSEEVAPVEMVTFNFSAEKAGDDTKTQAVVGATTVSYEWTDEDVTNIKLYLVDGTSLTEVASPVITKVSETKLTISATVPKADSYTFRAVLAREFYSKGMPMVSKYQSPKTDNYDPKGDILFSEDLDVDTDGTSSGEMLLTFSRKVAVSEMTLKNLGEGEKISKVEISSDTNGLVGYYDGTTITDLSDEIVLTYANEVVPASGEFVVYFTSAPISDQTLTVKVTTDAKTYTKEFARQISFALGTYFQFGVSLPAGEVPSDTWNLVKSTSPALADGDIIIITNTDATRALSTVQNTNNRAEVEITASADKSGLTSTTGAQEITLEATSTNFYLNVGTDSYLYAASSSNNHLKTNKKSTVGNNGIFEIEVDASGVASITAQGTYTRNKLKYNSGSSLFSCYGSGQVDVAIYRKTVADATVWNLKSIAINTDPDKVEYADGDVFDPTGMVVTATYEDNAGIKSDKEETISNSSLTTSPTILKLGDTKVTLSFGNKTVDVTGINVTVMPYTMVGTPSVLEVGVDYYIGGSTVGQYTGGTVGLWNGTVSSSTQCVTVDKTFTSATGSFDNVTGAELVVLEAVDGKTDTYYIKVKSSGLYLYNQSSNTLSTHATNKTAWTISEIGGEKNGMSLQSTTCKISSNGNSNRLRAYTSSNTYNGLFFFKKN